MSWDRGRFVVVHVQVSLDGTVRQTDRHAYTLIVILHIPTACKVTNDINC